MSKSFNALKAELLKFKEQKEIQDIMINLDTRKKLSKKR